MNWFFLAIAIMSGVIATSSLKSAEGLPIPFLSLSSDNLAILNDSFLSWRVAIMCRLCEFANVRNRAAHFFSHMGISLL